MAVGVGAADRLDAATLRRVAAAFARAVPGDARLPGSGRAWRRTLPPDALVALGCGGLLGVNKGSVQPPRIIRVGKGIMYDSGGISLKPSDASHSTVKNDMPRPTAAAAGALSTVYPALSRLDGDAFGVCVAEVTGALHEAGDARTPFPIMSVAKPFVFALVCEELGTEPVRRLVGVNATACRSTRSSRPSGTRPGVEPDGERGRGRDRDREPRARGDDRCAVAVPARRAVPFRRPPAGPGPGDVLVRVRHQPPQPRVNPLTGQRVVAPDVARVTLAVMAVAGLYERSGDWLVDVGVPGKSGIGGGIATVSPGKGGLGTWSPRLDAAGNSVRGRRAAQFLARRLGLDVLASAPVPQPALP